MQTLLIIMYLLTGAALTHSKLANEDTPTWYKWLLLIIWPIPLVFQRR